MRIFLSGLTVILTVGIIACTAGTTASDLTIIAAGPNSESAANTELASPTEPAILAADPTSSPQATILTIPASSTTVATINPTVMLAPSTPIIVSTQSADSIISSTVREQPLTSTKINYLSDEWVDVWLCKDSTVESADLTGGGTQTCAVMTEVVGENLVITSTGIPNHDFESTLGCCASEQNSVWTIPLEPELSDAAPVSAPERGPVAFTVSGVAIYGPEEGPGGDAVALEYGYFVEDRQAVDLGVCGGHAGPGGEYHYHYDSNCIHWHEDSQDIAGYSISELAETVLSKVIAFAFDGFPIYSTHEHDSSGATVEVTSSYRLKLGSNGYGGIDDYDYIATLGDLDACNGHFGATPEAPEGIYHYHSTLTNGEGSLGFPYFPLCYSGIVNESNYELNALDGGQRPDRGQRPPDR